ncbi:MAG: OB-fold domain-containing protein [Acidimicrobiia bacterium]
MSSPSGAPALVEHHVLEYPGGYTRSLGPVIGRFVTGLRDRRILGVRLADGRVLVPPLEYDPATAEPLGSDDDDFVEVGPSGVVESWTWVSEPRAGKHHLDRPFAFALVRPDGADTAMLHVVDAGSPEVMCVGLRVMPRWADEPTGGLTDLDAWVPQADGEEPVAPVEPGAAGDAVERVAVPIRLEYDISAGKAPGRFLRGLAQRRLVGERAADSDEVYVPPRGSDPKTGRPTEIEVEVGPRGTVTTFCIVNIPGLSALAPEIPYVCAQIVLDGASLAFFGLIGECEAEDVRMGMRVEVVWADEVSADQRSIRYFRPTGEADADYDDYKDFI